jgi:predicted TIM-barrel fold metal-dependent hydrolase
VSLVLGVTHSAPAFAVPAGTCDCHVHVFGPFERFPLAPDRSYTPGPASVEDLVALHRALRVDRVVIVQASPQGSDNACLVDALQRLEAIGRRARGVAVIAAAPTDDKLDTMHRAGVRGVRVNLESAGQHDPVVAVHLLRDAAACVAPLGWHVQTYTTLPVIASLHDVIMSLPTPLVIDHFGLAAAARGTGQAGFDALLSLVKSGQTYVKLSAAHRISELPDCADARIIARALIDAHPGRMLWGTDWPHPGAWPGLPRTREAIERFHPVDDGNALNRLATWVSADELQRILVDNPDRLYGF